MIDSPPVVITADPGGTLIDYMARRKQYLDDGRRIEIRGVCESACTVLIGLPDVCVTRNASLGFHAPTQRINGAVKPSGAKLFGDMMLEKYPEPVRKWIADNGGLTERLIYLRGRSLLAMFKECSK